MNVHSDGVASDIVLVHKREGDTPLETIGALRQVRPELAEVPIGYAGRLDPLASGLLLLLLGEANRAQKQWLAHDKQYEVEVLFGIRSDTYDVLGLVESCTPPAFTADDLVRAVRAFTGPLLQRPPPFSSYRVRGRPLFHWARAGTLDPADVPALPRTVQSIVVTSVTTVRPEDLAHSVPSRIARVRGNFRQAELLERWAGTLHTLAAPLPLATLRVHCSSGTYMRSIAHALGEVLGTGALAHRIVRTAIGPYTLADALELEVDRSGAIEPDREQDPAHDERDATERCDRTECADPGERQGI